ncbi:hypothetical protein L0222_06085 [bacterium]|nr:hypothetical protein [bacterium]
MTRFAGILLGLSLVLLSTSVYAASVVDVNVGDKEVNANISVDGVYAASLRIGFENVIGLTQDSISITAVQVDPGSLSLLQRIGNASLFSVPTLFPVMINVTPTPSSTLSFTGVVEIELSTSNLAFDTRLRLMKSPNGGNFDDITNFAGIGSYRVRGTSGDFSDFLIVLDVKPNSQAIDSKFTKLQYALSTHASRIEATMAQNLQTKLDSAVASYQSGSTQQTIDHLQSFIDDITADGGQKVPNTYRANDLNTVNVAGDLRRHAATLIFSLRL